MYYPEEIKAELKGAGSLSLPSLATRFFSTEKPEWAKKQLQMLERDAEIMLTRPAPRLSYSLYLRFRESGDRTQFEQAYFERRKRLFSFAVMTLLHGEAEWINALSDICFDICCEYSWCLPAHFPSGSDLFEARQTLDLYAAETALALAETITLCEGLLPSELVSLCDREIENRVFSPFVSYPHSFFSSADNWSAVCGGAVGAAAVYRVRERDMLATILSRATICTDSYLSGFGADGICTEGITYYTYGFGFFTIFSELLSEITGEVINIGNNDKVRSIALCQQRYYLDGGCTISFSDGDHHAKYRMGLTCMLAKKYCAEVPDLRFAANISDDICYHYALCIRDLLWYDEGVFNRSGENMPVQPAKKRYDSAWCPNAQWLISRGEQLSCAIKGGNNGESHNHNDCGSFVVCRGGKQLVSDFGAPLYDREYFSSRRYNNFIATSAAHSLPIIAGKMQTDGAQYTSTDVNATLGEMSDRFSADLTGCYSVAGLRFVRELCHNKKLGILLRDCISLNAPATITEIFPSRYPIEICENRRSARFSHEGSELFASFDGELFEAATDSVAYTDHNGRPKTAYRLLLTTKQPHLAQEFLILFADRAAE